MNKFFKALIIVNIVCSLIWHLLPWIVALDEQAETLLSWTGYLGNAFVRDKVFVYMSFIYPVCLIGVLFYVNVFRSLFTIVYLLQGFLLIFGGFYVSTPYDEFLEYFLTATGSVIIFISYFTSVSEKYSK